MFQTYAVIGSGLTLLGILYSYFFIRFLLTNKTETFVISVSDSLITVFIGVFYIYSAIVLAGDRDKLPMFNFTNNIDDIVTEYSFDSMSEQSTTNAYQNEDMNGFVTTVQESDLAEDQTEQEMEYINEEFGVYTPEIGNSTDIVETTTTKQNEHDDYLNYIKNLINQKLLNSSYHNKTIFYNNKQYRSLSRPKRDIKLEEVDTPDDKCFNELFISHALFLYSFLHCSITLVNNTLLGKKDEEDVTEQKTEDSNLNKDSDSEKNENSAPIGPLFNDSDKSAENIKELFKARSTHSLYNARGDEEKINENRKQIKKLKLVTYVLLMWLLPIIFIVIFYNILKSQNEGTNHMNYLSTLNLSSTQASPELINIIQSPTNVAPTQESVEVKNILKNVYTIVNEAQQQNTVKRNPHYATAMTDIMYFLNRNSKNYQNKTCFIQKMPLKIYFFIFIVIYILVILYAKDKQAVVKPQNKKGWEKFNMNILAFSFLWLPCVLELFFRIFLTQTKPNIFTDIFLILGNTNRLFTMTADYTKYKKLINRLSVVEPVV